MMMAASSVCGFYDFVQGDTFTIIMNHHYAKLDDSAQQNCSLSSLLSLHIKRVMWLQKTVRVAELLRNNFIDILRRYPNPQINNIVTNCKNASKSIKIRVNN